MWVIVTADSGTVGPFASRADAERYALKNWGVDLDTLEANGDAELQEVNK